MGTATERRIHRTVIVVDADAAEGFVLRIPEDVIAEGNHAVGFRRPAVGPLRLIITTDAAALVYRGFTSDLELLRTADSPRLDQLLVHATGRLATASATSRPSHTLSPVYAAHS